MKVAVIGAGASGLISAGFIGLGGAHVDLFEANEKIGKKLYITGKGRCNVTNYTEPAEILENVVTNSKFMYSSLYGFTSYDVVDFFERLGVPIKIERGNRAFPESDKSSDIIKALERFIKSCNVNLLLNSKVLDVYKNGESNKFCVQTSGKKYNDYDSVVLAVGGKTYSATGSVGDGYAFAKKFGHKIIAPVPGLVPILLNDQYVKSIEGLSLKNVMLSAEKNGKILKEFFGEMMFTSSGISGPIALSLSSYINKEKEIELYLDFKPALTLEKLEARIMRDIEEKYNSQTSTLICGLLPKNLAPIFLENVKIDKTRKNKTLNEQEIKKIATALKRFKLSYKSLDKLDFGIITSGGVDVSEVNPKTMESKIIDDLYIVGELLDVDALTGGFNLQIAFSTGVSASKAIINKYKGE